MSARRKKIVIENVAVATDATEKPKRVSKKRQFPVIATITPDSIEGNLQPENRKPLIAHLPIQSKDVIFHDNAMRYDPHPPEMIEPYDSAIDNPFFEVNEKLQIDVPTINNNSSSGNGNNCTTIKGTHDIPPNTDEKGYAVGENATTYYKGTLLVQFKDSSDVKAIPEKSNAACFWCCHTFDNRPVVLPLRDQGEYLQVYGNFCCPECAMSYLFDIRQDAHVRWEQLSILNRIYSDAVGGNIRPAPPKCILKHFGGHLTIEEYRSVIRNGKVRIDVHLPPMVSLLSTMDTKPVDFYDASLTKNVMETVKERLQKAEEVLKLRRTKPLKAWESTLDACMNLRIH